MFVRTRILAPAVLGLLVTACSTPPSGGGSSSSSTSLPATTTPAAAFTPLTRNLHPVAARHDLDIGRRDPSVLTAGSIYLETLGCPAGGA